MLTSLLRDRITVVWFVLVAATVASWILGVGHELGDRSGAIIIIVIAFAKVHFVGQYFMELRDAPIALRAVFGIWTIVVGLLLIGFYLLA